MRSSAASATASACGVSSTVATTLMQGASMSDSENPANTVIAGTPSLSVCRAQVTALAMAPPSVVLRRV